ncbi:Zinc protease [Mesobacillus boroniphilus JCM 21738]|uniref:Zinc protease n=2 Tax=Mesobacillus TaxID=2675231 RepID=W4RHV6_9BACI|nr:Zinc protease [Mesobacillus boroniphilus JCM 21738]
MVEVLYHNVVSGQNVSLDDWLQGMSKTTKEEIVDVAKKVQLDTVYFLTGLEADK